MVAASAAATWLVVLLAVLLANLPFINERLFVFGPRKDVKSVGWRLLELLLFAALLIVIGRVLEGRQAQVQEQGWPFYAVVCCLFLTLAFPGFAWRYLRRQRTH